MEITVQEFIINRFEKDIDEIKADVKGINNKIDDLASFKFKLLGAAIAASAIWTVIINVIFLVMKVGE